MGVKFVPIIDPAKSRENHSTTICVTRYGNVLGSRGSVIPLFIEQIKNKLPISITDPNMTRFMMTLDDAVDLVIYAFDYANQGDLFIQKAPSATIETLAKALLDLYNSDNEIKIIGTRHGEKLYETLCTREEMLKAEDMGDFFRIPSDNRDLNYAQYFSEGEKDISKVEDYHSHNTKQQSVQEMKLMLNKLALIKKEVHGENIDQITH
jgi:UDP-glucose 4-epimerase